MAKVAPKHLIIVESPTKAKTISRFLGSDYITASSFGHVRDLPKTDMGVDIEHDFAPRYVIPTKSKKTISELKKLAQGCDVIYFATDEDREGEAIAWHLADILKPDPEKSKRIAFHEITKEAIMRALEHPRQIDLGLVDAQQARRILDRLVGYELSPFLWHKVAKGLSAGRVQSVAVRILVEREREIEAFKAQEYWSIEGIFVTEKKEELPAQLYKIKKEPLDKFALPSQEDAQKILTALHGATYSIAGVEAKKTNRNAPAPFTTSTLQQDANHTLGFSAKQTMRQAQVLYEEGYITYMRTDSTNLADKFLNEAGPVITKQFGKDYYGGRMTYTTKAKVAQEAHEAIRPTDVSVTPESVKEKIEPSVWRVYDLIWRRAVASQMTKASLETTTIDIKSSTEHYFKTTGSVLVFSGWLEVYPEKIKENVLPKVAQGDAVREKSITPEQHFTQPPPRYTEASLVKALEEYGIGRPSTYAPTISTIIERGYVNKQDKALVPSDIAKMVTDILVEHFPHIVDFEFTARMEDQLDSIASGELDWVPTLREFYGPFKENLDIKEQSVKKKTMVEETDEVCEKCGKPMVIRMGRFGKFLACTGFPECKNTKPIAGSKEAPKPTGVKCPECKEGDMVERRSRRGTTFYSCSRYPDCTYALSKKKAYVVLGIGDNSPSASADD